MRVHELQEVGTVAVLLMRFKDNKTAEELKREIKVAVLLMRFSFRQNITTTGWVKLPFSL